MSRRHAVLLGLGTLTARVVACQEAAVLRAFALCVIALQLAAALAAVLTQVMLHGDGAYFVYALSVDEPWLLKWRDLAARATVYVLTVAPTLWVSESLHLSPLAISALNGFLFYLVPVATFAIACAIVWRTNPKLLLFPIAQYALSSALGYGFPSEILLAPGFLWIALFLIAEGRAFSPWFFLSFAALLFSHELAIPAACVVATLAVGRMHPGGGASAAKRWSMILALLLLGLLLILVRATGGGTGSNGAIIYVFDPRRVLNDPTLWIMIPVLAAVAAFFPLRRQDGQRVGAVGFALAVLGALLLPFLLQAVVPGLDFEHGRYDTARTAVGLLMLGLALAFASLSRVGPERDATDEVRRWAGLVPVGLAAALAVSVGSAVLFLRDWSAAVHGLQRVVEAGPAVTTPEFVSYDEARPLMAPEEARANDRIEFQWVLPFRSLVLANGSVPTRVVHGESDLTDFCDKLRTGAPDRTAIPASSTRDMADFACRYQAPPASETIGKKAMATLRRWMSRLF